MSLNFFINDIIYIYYISPGNELLVYVPNKIQADGILKKANGGWKFMQEICHFIHLNKVF